MKVLSVCGDGKSGFAENLGQNYLKIETIATILQKHDFCLLVKSNLVNFYFHIFVDTEKLLPAYRLGGSFTMFKLVVAEFVKVAQPQSDLRVSFLTQSFLRVEGVIDGGVLFRRYLKLLINILKTILTRGTFQSYD